MKLPKTPSGVRYAGSTDYNTQITIVQPGAGNALDGTPLPETTVASTWANVAEWRGKEADKQQTIQAVSSYKIIIRYPKTYSLDTGMNILVRGQRHNIDSFSDPDGQRVQLTIWTWVGDDAVVNS
jgi:SPP1 family predicted phage head-tail adaptor